MRKRASFLTADERKALLNVMRKRKVEALQVRRANALVALDDGHSVQMVSRIFYLDPDTVRGWLDHFAPLARVRKILKMIKKDNGFRECARTLHHNLPYRIGGLR